MGQTWQGPQALGSFASSCLSASPTHSLPLSVCVEMCVCLCGKSVALIVDVAPLAIVLRSMEESDMARAVYQHELQDQDFAWLLQRFQESNPEYVVVDSAVLPVVLIMGARIMPMSEVPLVLGAEEDTLDEGVLGDPEA